MGAWDASPFGNDGALDWLASLEPYEDGRYLEESVNSVLDASDVIDTQLGEVGIAAAAIIAAAGFEKVRAIPEDAKSWIERRGFVPTERLLGRTIEAVERIRDRSELVELWREGESAAEWELEIEKLLGRLRKARTAPSVTRIPKKRGFPRSIAKLVHRAWVDRDEEMRTRLRKKLAALENVNSCDRDTGFEYPLILVAEAGFEEETAMLLGKGADPNLESPVTGRRALSVACQQGRSAVAKLLLDAGAELFSEITIDAKTGLTIEIAKATEKEVEPVPFRFSQPLFSAVYSGDLDTFDLLIDRGADPLQVDLNGDTLLHKACQHGKLSILTRLIALGVDVNRLSHLGRTALHYAAQCGGIGAATELLAAGVDPNVVDTFEGRTALDMIPGGATELVGLIRESGGLSADEIGVCNNS